MTDEQQPFSNPNEPPQQAQPPQQYQPQQPQPQQQVSDGLAIGSLICGIASFFILGIVLGIVAIVLARMYKSKGGTSKLATAGMVLGIVGIVLAIIALVLGVGVTGWLGSMQ